MTWVHSWGGEELTSDHYLASLPKFMDQLDYTFHMMKLWDEVVVSLDFKVITSALHCCICVSESGAFGLGVL